MPYANPDLIRESGRCLCFSATILSALNPAVRPMMAMFQFARQKSEQYACKLFAQKTESGRSDRSAFSPKPLKQPKRDELISNHYSVVLLGRYVSNPSSVHSHRRSVEEPDVFDVLFSKYFNQSTTL